jgi:hypothetical protein
MQRNFQFSRPVPVEVFQLAGIHDNRYLASGIFESGRYAILNTDGEIERIFGDYPDFTPGEKDYPYDGKAMFHQVQFGCNRNIRKIACVSSHVADIVDFSDSIAVEKTILLDSYRYRFSTGNIQAAERMPGIARGAVGVTTTDHFYI